MRGSVYVFDVKTQMHNEILEIKLSGSLDMGGVDLFEEILAKQDFSSVQSVSIDMQDMVFIDSTGIGSVINFTRQLGDTSFQFTNVSNEIKEIFSIIGLDGLFENL